MPTYSGLYNLHYTDGQTAIGVGLPTARIVDSAELNHRFRAALGKMMRTRAGRIYGRLLVELTGTAPGAAALTTHRRVAMGERLEPLQNGGVRVVETQNLLNRNTTAGDATNIDADALMAFGPAIGSYPVDRSGNGGGGKVQGF